MTDALPPRTVPMTVDDVLTVSEGIENFIMNGDPEVNEIWQPYVDQLIDQRRILAAASDLLAALKRSLDWLASYPADGAKAAYEQARVAIDKTEEPRVPMESAQPCGCDPGANWICEVHRSAVQS